MKLNEIQEKTPELGLNFEGLGKSGDLYLRFEGNHQWSVIHLNCFEKFLRWLGFYASTQLETIAQNLTLENDLPEALINKITACWNHTYPSKACPLAQTAAARQIVPDDAVPPEAEANELDFIKTRPPHEQMDFSRINPDSHAFCGNIAPEKLTIHDATLSIQTGDIFQSGVSCIVNAANEQCLGGSGIDGAIHKAGGRALYDQCYALPVIERDARGREIRCRTGDAVITPSGNLAAGDIKHIIHAVGPTGRQANRNRLLESAYLNIMRKAEENGIRSLAIPAISTGIFGFPFGEATKIALRAIKQYLQHHQGKFDEVKLVFLDNTRNEAMNCAWAIHIARSLEQSR